MDLKDFVKESAKSLIEASLELEVEFRDRDVIINPPLTDPERDAFDASSIAGPIRRVTLLDFDVAITASSETKGGGKAGLKVLSAELGGEGSHSSASEQVSRIKFSFPLAMPPTDAEHDLKQRQDEQHRKINRQMGRS